jgi:AcrR family transcriptional regulator
MTRSSAAPNARGNIKQQLASLKRDGILEVATKLFVKHGYHGCSMDAIAAAIGVTKPFIYYQFRDKAEILAAICRSGAELTLSAIGEAEKLAGSNEERLNFFCTRLAEIVIRHDQFLMVYMRELGNLSEQHRHALVRMRDEIDHRVSRLIAAGAAAGEFEVKEPLIAARAITGMLSYIYMWHRESDPIPDNELGKTMAEIAMRTLFAPARKTGKTKSRTAIAPRRRTASSR